MHTRNTTAILMLFLCLFPWGCLRSDTPSPYLRDGVYYGVTEGRFRGRWWNHYERARSFMGGGFYQEAAQDLRIALIGRDRDQLWPRTYGLHFIPAYFPHRELGIALYYQGILEESRDELELSYAQRESARAAYFLGEVRRQLLQKIPDNTAAPEIELIAPEQATVLSASEILVSGVARGDAYVESVTVNDQLCDIKICDTEVHFSSQLSLAPGENDLRIEAVDLLGKKGQLRILLRCDLDGPTLSFDAPVLMPGAIQGIVYDPSGVQQVFVGGKEAQLTPLDHCTARFSLHLAEAELSPPIVFEASDKKGNLTQGQVTPDLLVLQSKIPDIAPANMEQLQLAPNLRAIAIDGEIVAVAAAPKNGAGIEVKLSNIDEGQEHFSDEIIVALHVVTPEAIEALSLNDMPLTTIPGRKSLRMSRRITLEEGNNTIHASALNDQGLRADVKRTVIRKPNDIEIKRNKLCVAFMEEASKALNPEMAAEIDGLINDLIATQSIDKRFDVLDRALINEVLQEQSLAQLAGTQQGKAKLGEKLLSADILFTVRLRHDHSADTLEIVVDGASAENGRRVLSHIDVAGPYAERERLIEDLGLRLSQEFRRTKGMVLDWSPPELYFDLASSQGMRDYFKCLVYRTVDVLHPRTGAKMGVKPEILGEGTIIEVQEELSAAEIHPGKKGESVEDLPIEVGHYVTLK